MARPKKVVKPDVLEEPSPLEAESSLERENRALKERIKLLSTQKPVVSTDKYMKEMQNIRKVGRDTSNTIVVKEINDHKNISLWTLDGKRLGPLHPRNAEATMTLFYNLGIMLTVAQPTNEQIEEYKKTDEYKTRKAAFDKERARKEKSRRGGQMEKFAAQIAKELGMTVEAITNIVTPDKVRAGTQ